MPTYEYLCTECKHKLEVRQKISEPAQTICPECHKETLVRGIGGGAATLRFVGDGFYKNDYAKDSCCPCGKKQTCGE